jgi:4-carboxymuconolactone decarboxylase
VIEFGYGDIHSRPGLDAARRELVILSSLITAGAEPMIEVHIGVALAAGLTAAEIVEAILQLLPYCGFPRVVAAMTIARSVFAARGLLPVQPPRNG